MTVLMTVIAVGPIQYQCEVIKEYTVTLEDNFIKTGKFPNLVIEKDFERNLVASDHIVAIHFNARKIEVMAHEVAD